MEPDQSPSLIRHIEITHSPRDLEREWIVTNGLGGYASGTIAGVNTRRFHGCLIAALAAPRGRTMMLNQLEETLYVEGKASHLAAEDLIETHDGGTVSPFPTAFRLENGLPVFTYAAGEAVLEKRICMVHRRNTTYISYRLLEGSQVRLQVRPAVDIRAHEGPVSGAEHEGYRFSAGYQGYEIHAGNSMPALRLSWLGEETIFHLALSEIRGVRYRLEEARGYDWSGNLWSPGCFSAMLSKGGEASLVLSTEDWDHMNAMSPKEAFSAEGERRRRLLRSAPEAVRSGMAAELVLAADQFLIAPVGRTAEAVKANSRGDELRAVIAGYHWFTDWGRDTMISLEGLTLATGRTREAGSILRSFAKYIRHGLIPNLFPEGRTQGLYNTADATLWFFHAADRYFKATGDVETYQLLLPVFLKVIESHREGTDFNIEVDPSDGLLRQGEEGYQLTWMDAKVDGWVVTPRRGKAVEINALWYNALSIAAEWCERAGEVDKASELRKDAAQVYESFNDRFWAPALGYCYDVVDKEKGGDDAALRPNQVLGISLSHAVLAPDRWSAVLDVVRQKLLTPMGLRSLAPGEPDYKPHYEGQLRARDAAYHQGSVWTWLIGPFFDAWLRAHPGDWETAVQLLKGFDQEMGDAGIGTVSEIFDAEAPFTPRGCIAQAWSVAEVLRCELRLRTGRTPP